MNRLMNRKFREGIIITLILLSLVLAFLDEYAGYALWSVSARNGLLYAGFLFDLIFSIEFIIRGIHGRRRGEFIFYIKYKQGWIDFLCSFPLLFLYSGPSVYLLLAGDIHYGTASFTMFNMVKVIKAVRIIRILRLLRFIRIMGRIHYSGSKMAQHHIVSAATTAVFTVIIVLMGWGAVSGLTSRGDVQKREWEYSRFIEELESLSSLNGLDFRSAFENLLVSDQRIVRIDYTDGKIYERLSVSEFKKYYTNEDFITVRGSLCSLIISVKDIESEIAVNNIRSFFIVVFILISFTFIYSSHFVHTVSDVADILNRGFRKKDYNLMVKIREEYGDEELYRLARFYNDAYLPAKLKRAGLEKIETGSPLEMDDVNSFGKRGD